MRKNLLTLAPLSLLLLATIGGAQAASNAVIKITGNVAAETCDVRSSVSSLDLGNYSPSQFIVAAVPVKSSERQFTVELSNCGNIPSMGMNTVSVKVLGSTIADHPNIFNSTGTNTGVMLREISDSSNYIKSGDEQKFPRVQSMEDILNFSGEKLTFIAAIASSSTVANVDIGSISAPITFQFVYN